MTHVARWTSRSSGESQAQVVVFSQSARLGAVFHRPHPVRLDFVPEVTLLSASLNGSPAVINSKLEVPMVQEATTPQYSAVLCRHCRQPIPVPSIVTRMENLLNTSDSAVESDRAFTLRCRSCECEHPYRSSQIVQVDGEPRGRRALARATNA